MKFWARVGDRSYEVTIRESGGRTICEIAGQTLDLLLEEGATGTYTLVLDGVAHSLAAVPRADGYSIAVDGVPFDVELEDERQHRVPASGKDRHVADGAVTVRAPMAGLVTHVTCAEGDRVEKGDRLLVLEAMKMENDIRAPRAGLVSQIKVAERQTVEQGQLLLTIE